MHVQNDEELGCQLAASLEKCMADLPKCRRHKGPRADIVRSNVSLYGLLAYAFAKSDKLTGERRIN